MYSTYYLHYYDRIVWEAESRFSKMCLLIFLEVIRNMDGTNSRSQSENMNK